MKTILITVLQGVEARNILRTDIFRVLRRRADLKIVLLVPHEAKKKYYQKEFRGENVAYVIARDYAPINFLDAIFSRLKFTLLRTRTMDHKRRMRFEATGNVFNFTASFLLSRLFGHTLFIRFFQWLDYRLISSRHFQEILDAHTPDLVFAAHPFADIESALLRESRRRNIKTVGLINSWDKFTARNLIRTLPDRMIVHNEIILKEALRFTGMRRNCIHVVGVPHFDQYNSEPRVTRDELFQKIGADPRKRLLMFAPIGRSLSDVDGELMEILNELLVRQQIPNDVQFLVRFPPNDIVDLNGVVDGAQRGAFIFEQPGVRFSRERGVDWDMTDEEVLHLRDEFAYVDMLITHVSTLIIEAALVDKPIISIGFDGKRKRRMANRATRLLSYTHFQPVARSGGVRIVRNSSELASAIHEYLNNPSLDQSGRQRIVREQCWQFDGAAGQRAGDYIIEYMNG